MSQVSRLEPSSQGRFGRLPNLEQIKKRTDEKGRDRKWGFYIRFFRARNPETATINIVVNIKKWHQSQGEWLLPSLENRGAINPILAESRNWPISLQHKTIMTSLRQKSNFRPVGDNKVVGALFRVVPRCSTLFYIVPPRPFCRPCPPMGHIPTFVPNYEKGERKKELARKVLICYLSERKKLFISTVLVLSLFKISHCYFVYSKKHWLFKCTNP